MLHVHFVSRAQAFVSGCVPVYHGKYPAASIAPGPHSFIDTRDFASPAALAKHLAYLDGNDTAYLEYFEWKRRGVSDAFLRFSHDNICTAPCRLCNTLVAYYGAGKKKERADDGRNETKQPEPQPQKKPAEQKQEEQKQKKAKQGEQEKSKPEEEAATPPATKEPAKMTPGGLPLVVPAELLAPKVAAEVRSHTCNPVEKCNVCKSCCFEYIPMGAPCDACFARQCAPPAVDPPAKKGGDDHGGRPRGHNVF